VAKDDRFIFTDAEGFDEPDMDLAMIKENGTIFLCLSDACIAEGKEKLRYFAGGGLGG
jgi:hypothetical protein